MNLPNLDFSQERKSKSKATGSIFNSHSFINGFNKSFKLETSCMNRNVLGRIPNSPDGVQYCVFSVNIFIAFRFVWCASMCVNFNVCIPLCNFNVDDTWHVCTSSLTIYVQFRHSIREFLRLLAYRTLLILPSFIFLILFSEKGKTASMLSTEKEQISSTKIECRAFSNIY